MEDKVRTSHRSKYTLNIAAIDRQNCLHARQTISLSSTRRRLCFIFRTTRQA
ncbi:hypothetical protein CCACVL1_04073 [Corchorus capsularis]|uniref:Uncharacterized protein n=1 Tax=Corchorus capsularis TaxID=210143 RepID=A0A1R3JV71_COCAP|nr:hypothetical protein CCACVL1_04073 [Corchorus capsularis]